MFTREVKCRIIRDSRGEKTIEVILKTYEGTFRASAPEGKSRGKSEVQPYCDEGIKESYARLKVLCNILEEKNFMIKTLADLAILTDWIKRFESSKGFLGGNVQYVLETVFLKAAAAEAHKPLWKFIHDSISYGKNVKIPMPVGNCI